MPGELGSLGQRRIVIKRPQPRLHLLRRGGAAPRAVRRAARKRARKGSKLKATGSKHSVAHVEWAHCVRVCGNHLRARGEEALVRRCDNVRRALHKRESGPLRLPEGRAETLQLATHAAVKDSHVWWKTGHSSLPC